MGSRTAAWRLSARGVRRRVSGEAGQDLVEYGLLMALIAVVAMAGVTTLGNTITNVMWNTIVNNF